MNLSEWQTLADQQLKAIGIEAHQTEVQWMIEDLLSLSPIQRRQGLNLPLTPDQIKQLNTCLQERLKGVPIAYLLKHWHFWDFTLKSDRRALIPRPDTERLVETAVAYLKKVIQNGNPQPKIIEIGTGTGCISIALAREIPQAQILALDLSIEALSLAQENIQALKIKQIQLIHSDLFDVFGIYENGQVHVLHPKKHSNVEHYDHPLLNLLDGQVDLLISNPPYIQTEVVQTLDSSVKDFEPHLALDGGDDGLFLIRKIIDQSKIFLQPKGALMFEIGFDQGQALSKLLTQAGFRDVQVIKDYGQQDRVAIGRID